MICVKDKALPAAVLEQERRCLRTRVRLMTLGRSVRSACAFLHPSFKGGGAVVNAAAQLQVDRSTMVAPEELQRGDREAKKTGCLLLVQKLNGHRNLRCLGERGWAKFFRNRMVA